eukprot:m.1257827 g.1257827  ORF g.1257827 m.1257827 type:complete len:438 (+) comp24715_c0_seq44:321-1634(+)
MATAGGQSEGTTDIAKWLRALGPSVDSSSVEKAAHMGVLKPKDFLLFDHEELVDVYGFSAESATSILNALDDDSEESQAPAPIQCEARYEFAAIKNTHLNADVGDRFLVLNATFDWWLCQSTDGKTGLLPRNYLTVLDETEGADATLPDPTFHEQEYAVPQVQIRKVIREISDECVRTADLHLITYIRVKNTLVQQFGEDAFVSEIEHVKEMLRRTEEVVRYKHDSTLEHAQVAIKAAQKHTFMTNFFAGVRRVSGRDNQDTSRKGNSKSATLKSAKGDADPQKARRIESIPMDPVPPPPSHTLRKVKRTTALESWEYWTGGWFIKKGAGSKMGITMSLSERRRWFQPANDHTLNYYTSDKQLDTPKGAIDFSRGATVVAPACVGACWKRVLLDSAYTHTHSVVRLGAACPPCVNVPLQECSCRTLLSDRGGDTMRS